MTARCQLYLVSPPEIGDLEKFAAGFAEALSGGVACFQLRLKARDGRSPPDAEVLRIARRLLPIARDAGIAFLLNDRPDLAKLAGADGVHVGQSDMRLADARALLGAQASIGVTCHASIHLAMEAGEGGADYVAFGAFFPTATKAATSSASLDLLESWSFATTVPCVAIGGITPGNCEPLIRAGADFIAVSSAVWAHPNGPAAAIQEFQQAIERASA